MGGGKGKVPMARLLAQSNCKAQDEDEKDEDGADEEYARAPTEERPTCTEAGG